jgi:acetate kinase
VSWTKQHVLTINGGSSSVKFALYEIGSPLQQRLTGKIDRIGLSGTMLIFNDTTRDQQGSLSIDVCDYNSAANFLLDWLEQHVDFTQVKAVGHRVVHGMQHAAPELVSQSLLDELHNITSVDPEHLPGEIELFEVFRRRYPQLLQVACFDTAFHCSMPRVARLLRLRVASIPWGCSVTGFMVCPMLILCNNSNRLPVRKRLMAA